MECKECNYYWKAKDDDFPCCHFDAKYPDDVAPCEYDDVYDAICEERYPTPQFEE